MNNTGYADFSCSVADGRRRCELANAVPYDFDALYPSAVHALCLVHIDFFHKLADHLRRELLYIRVLPHKREKVVNVEGTLIFSDHGGFQFSHTALKGMLLGFVVGVILAKRSSETLPEMLSS
jgi:hypothetical protein